MPRSHISSRIAFGVRASNLAVVDLGQGRRSQPIDDAPLAPPGRRDRPREVAHEFREIHRPRPRFRPVRAKSLALREGHQQFAPEHLLKVLLDDPEGLAAGLIDRSGGRSREALAAVEAALAKRPKVSGGGAGQVYLDAGAGARLRPGRRRSPRRPATASSRSSGCCSRSRSRRTARPARSSASAGVTPQNLNAAIEALRKGRTADTRVGRERL